MTPLHSPRRHQRAFTWIEAIVCFCIIVILIALALPTVTSSTPHRDRRMQTLSNMRQLHLATTQMSLDGSSADNTNLNWPGDTGGTFTNWATLLVPSYLGTNDFCKLLSATGKVVPPGKLPANMSDTALLVYSVKEESSGNTVFLTTANFTNTPSGGAPLDPKTKPFGAEGFVVFRKGGDGAILLPKQTNQTNIIGSFVPLCR